MQWFIFCFLLIAIACLILGAFKSTFDRHTGSKQYCVACGWTREMVRPCQFEQRHVTKVAPLCFDCSIARDAVPVKTHIAKVYLTI